MDAGEAHHLGPQNIEFGEGGGEADRLGQTMFGQAAAAIVPGVGMQDIGPRLRGGGGAVARLPPLQEGEVIVFVFPEIGNQSSPS